MAYSVRTGDCTDAGLSGEVPVIGSTPLFQGSTPSAPVDIALSDNFSAKETFDSESQGSSVEEFYSPPSTLECTPDTPRGSIAQTEGTLPPSDIACRAEKFYTPRAPTPEKLKKLVSFLLQLLPADEVRFQSAPEFVLPSILLVE